MASVALSADAGAQGIRLHPGTSVQPTATHAGRAALQSHRITLGSRDPASKGDLRAPVASLATVVADHDVVVNATPGSASLELVQRIGAVAFAGKVLVDVANAAASTR